jgi:hypothetical protein
LNLGLGLANSHAGDALAPRSLKKVGTIALHIIGTELKSAALAE